MFLILISCSADTNNLVSTDLLLHGEAITIMAPKDATITVQNYGLMKDIIITDSLDYQIEIFIAKATSLNIEKAIADQKDIVEKSQYFSQIIEDNEHGFIYEKKIDENNVRYDFRYIIIQADKKYTFQPSLSGGHNKANVRKMYEAIQQ